MKFVYEKQLRDESIKLPFKQYWGISRRTKLKQIVRNIGSGMTPEGSPKHLIVRAFGRFVAHLEEFRI